MKKTTIDTSLLPHIWLTWETTKGKFYLDCQTGKKSSEEPEFARNRRTYYGGNKFLLNSGSRPRLGYAKYHEDIQCLELAEVTIDTTRKEEVKQWKYSGNKYFLAKDKSVFDENGNKVTSGFVLSRYHNAYNFANFLGMFYRISCCYNASEFKKFLGSDTYNVGSGRVVQVTGAWNIQEWYKTSQKVRKPGKQQKLTDQLTAMPVGDTTGLSQKYPIIKENDGWYSSTIGGLIYFERLNDGWSVLRIFDRYSGKDELHEKERMYLHDDGTNRIVTPAQDGWVPSRQTNGWCRYRFANKEEAMQKCNRLKYILPLVDKASASQIKNHLMTILRFPEIEQMISLGYKNEAQGIVASSTPMADLKYMFGGHYKEKEKSILRKVGLTKTQFDKYMELRNTDGWYTRRYCHYALIEMRKMFGEDLTHIDNATFNKYCTAFVLMQNGSYRGEMYCQIDQMDIDRNKFIKNAIRLGEKNENVYRVLNDTLNGYRALNTGTHPEINWYFDSYSDVVRAHDAIDALKRAQDEERRALWDMAAAERRKKEEEKRKKLDEERKKYEYEDDTYIIRLPQDSNEIIREGNMQRICIGGYTSDHALGRTNLFFLRKKEDPTMPFYAIEMDNSKIINQIHGYCNSWLGKHPEAIPTVVRWLRKNGIKCDEKILTCTSTGYCSNNQYVKMPVVD